MTEESQTTSMHTIPAELFKGHLAVMRFIHFTLVGSIILFGVIVMYVIHKKMTFAPEAENPLFIVAAALTTVVILFSSAMHMFFFKSGTMPAEVQGAVHRYQVFVLIRAAVVEGAALFSAVATLVSRNILPAGLLALCVAALIILVPSRHEFIRLMKSCQTSEAE